MRAPASAPAPSIDHLAARARSGDRQARKLLDRLLLPRLTRLAVAVLPDASRPDRVAREALRRSLRQRDAPLLPAAVQAVQAVAARDADLDEHRQRGGGVGRIVLVLVDLDGYSHERAAQLLGLPVETVRTHHDAARRALGVTGADSTCRGWHLVTRLEGLTEPERAAAERHVRLCRLCRDAWESRRDVRRRLLVALPLLAMTRAAPGLSGLLQVVVVPAVAVLLVGLGVLVTVLALGGGDDPGSPHVGARPPAAAVPAAPDATRPADVSTPAAVGSGSRPSTPSTPFSPVPPSHASAPASAPARTPHPPGPVVALSRLTTTDAHVEVGAAGLVPGDVIRRPLTLTHVGNESFTAVTMTSTAARSSLLDTAPDGLRLSVDRCPVPWEQPVPDDPVYRCRARVERVLQPRPVTFTAVRLPGSPARAQSGRDHLLVTVGLPPEAPPSLQGQASVLRVTFTGHQE